MERFRLNSEDRKYLRSIGYIDKDFSQIEAAANVTDYYHSGSKISEKKCIEILGRTRFLSGISRSAFHKTAVRFPSDHSDETVFFDTTWLHVEL